MKIFPDGTPHKVLATVVFIVVLIIISIVGVFLAAWGTSVLGL